MLKVVYQNGEVDVYRETEKDFLNMLFCYFWDKKEQLKIERIVIDYEN